MSTWADGRPAFVIPAITPWPPFVSRFLRFGDPPDPPDPPAPRPVPPPKPAPPSASGAAATPEPDGDGAALFAPATFLGRTAVEWRAEVASADPATSLRALRISRHLWSIDWERSQLALLDLAEATQ